MKNTPGLARAFFFRAFERGFKSRFALGSTSESLRNSLSGYSGFQAIQEPLERCVVEAPELRLVITEAPCAIQRHQSVGVRP